MCSRRRQTRSSARRGTIYLVVLISSVIVATIGMGTLQLLRLQANTAGSGNDFLAARFHARAGIEIGMLKIRNDPYWRTNLGNGVWMANRPIGNGKFSLSVLDPIDGDVTTGDNNPVILQGTGVQGAAIANLSVRLEVGPRVGSCLEVSMISGNDSNVVSATLTSDQTVSANGKYNANTATVNANVEAVKGIGGLTYTKTLTNKILARDLPDPLHALDYYLTNGTTIPYTALTYWSQSEMLVNTKFETDTSNWHAYGTGTCLLQLSTAQVKEGLYSLLVKSRTLATVVAGQDLPISSLKSGNKYDLSLPIFPSAVGTAQAVLTLTSTGEGVQTFATPAVTLAKNLSGVFTWTDLKGTVTPTWTGTLTKATVSVGMSVKNNYYMDKVSMVDSTYDKNTYVIDRQLISPNVNPYGATNAQGIYIIQCADKDVVVGRSRIAGTLVFVSAGDHSALQDSVSCEPAIWNYPSLLFSGGHAFDINTNSVGLSEVGLGINLNPPGTPYPYIGGAENATLTDSYPSKITGLMYSTNDLTFSATPTIMGVVIANGKITVNADSLTLYYNNIYLNNPPPGFDIGTVTMKVVPGTWQRTVN